MKRPLLLFLLVLSFYFFPKNVYAQENFSTTTDANYTVKESGITHVELATSLTNLTSKHYAASYKEIVGFTNIQNITARDIYGNLETKVDKAPDKTTIEVLFNKNTVGINAKIQFIVSFDTTDVLQDDGTIKEITIPGVQDSANFSAFNVHITVPPSFGEPTYIKPASPLNFSSSHLDFTLDQLKKSGISIAFGQKQVYEFTLQYNLKNTNFFPITTEIALPPATNYQDVYFDTISPKPIQVIKDPDGNWLARYQLKPTQKEVVTVKGLASVSLDPKRQKEDDTSLQQYLKEEKNWNFNASEIKAISKNLNTPEAIYGYVVKTLHYDFSRVSSNEPRLGAQSALLHPQSAVCLEFTDLFIAIARANGIPAREVDGFANTHNSRQRPISNVTDILHAWPEYYDRNLETWVMVDPTWGNTSGGVDYFNVLDFDHFAFVIKGKNSEYPIPPGGYKLAGKEDEKNVFVSVSQRTPQAIYDSQAELNFSKEYMAFFPINGQVIVHNNGNTLYPSQALRVTSFDLAPHDQTVQSGDIPPFGYEVLPVTFNKTPFLTNKEVTLTIRFGSTQLTHTIIISPFVLTINTAIGGLVIIGIFSFIIFILTKRTRRISVS